MPNKKMTTKTIIEIYIDGNTLGTKPLILSDNLKVVRDKIRTKLENKEYCFLDKSNFKIDEEDEGDYNLGNITNNNKLNLKSKNNSNNNYNNDVIIRYNFDSQGNFSLFGWQFVQNNKYKCKVIIDNVEHDLGSCYYMYDDKNKRIINEIRLRGINNITNFSYMFCGCNYLYSIPENTNWSRAKVTDMSYMFSGVGQLNSLPGINNNLNTINVTNMKGMFRKSYCEFIPDISKLNTSNVTDMSEMFYECIKIKNLPDLSKWNTSKVKNMSQMFYNCQSLEFQYWPDILSNWNTSNVENMEGMFYSCEKLTHLPDISKWNTSNVKNMSYIFYNCTKLGYLPDISNWNTSNVENMEGMFYSCEKLTYLPDISKWNTSKVKSMKYLFNNCESLNHLPDISKWNTSNVEKMGYMFGRCRSLYSLPDLTKWNVSKITDKEDLKNITYYCNVSNPFDYYCIIF